jgi:hypothetical protein
LLLLSAVLVAAWARCASVGPVPGGGVLSPPPPPQAASSIAAVHEVMAANGPQLRA